MKTYCFPDLDILGKKITFHIEVQNSIEALWRLLDAIDYAERKVYEA